MKFRIIGIIFLLAAGCTQSRKPLENVSRVKIVRFDRDLFALDPQHPDIVRLNPEDTAFLKLYVKGVLQLGEMSAPDFPDLLSVFLQDSVIREIRDSVCLKYADLSQQEEELTEAFAHYRTYFPSKTLPRVYTHISGFNQSVVVDSGLIGIALDNYLGADCVFYKMLATPVPRYICRRMTERDIVRDAVYGWVSAEFPFRPRRLDLLSGMVYQGKIIYLMEKLLPDYAKERLFGYTSEQLDWCKAGESSIWAFMVDHEYLFENQQMLFRKYLDEAPFSSGMPPESPGKAVVWCGYRIVCDYVKKSGSSLQDLMEEQDYHKMLRGAGYRP